MQEIKVHVIHEWRSGHADPLARIERIIETMDDISTRLTTSIDNLALALGNQTSAIGEVASAIRNHPASTTDNGALSALADRLDGITASINSSTSELQTLTVEEDVEDANSTENPAPAEPAPPSDAQPDPAAENPPSDSPPPVGADDSSAGAGSDVATDTGIAGDGTLTDQVPDAGNAEPSTGEASDGASLSDGSSGTTSGDAVVTE